MFRKVSTAVLVSICLYALGTGVARAQLLQFEGSNVLGGSIVVGTTTVTFDIPSPSGPSAQEQLQRILFYLRSDTPIIGTQSYSTLPNALLDITFGAREAVQESTGEATTTVSTVGTSVSTCEPFTQNLTLGANSAEVMRLQLFLNQDVRTRIAEVGPGSPGEETTYFGERTRAAVRTFQTIHTDAVLTPAGLSEATGYWGVLTREYANQLLDCATNR